MGPTAPSSIAAIPSQAPTASPLLLRVRDTIARHALIRHSDRVVVGVSGGADSVTLLHLLTCLQQPFGLTLYVVHVDHQLRSDAAEDAVFVKALAEQWRIPIAVERKDVQTVCREQGWSLEEGARRIRYACFLEAARRHSAHVVALAHTADDQAETVLMRLIRGAGVTGLAAIPFSRTVEGVRIVRPLLEVWRHEILDYLGEAGLRHRDDASNADVRFLRNRVRHELLPLLQRAYNPKMKAALAQLAEHSRSDTAFLEGAATRVWKRMAKRVGANGVAVAVGPFRRQPEALQRQLVRQAIRQVRGDLTAFEFRHWLELVPLFQTRPLGVAVDLPGGVRAHRERDRVMFESSDRVRQLPPVE